jgi:hypothetical protein
MFFVHDWMFLKLKDIQKKHAIGSAFFKWLLGGAGGFHFKNVLLFLSLILPDNPKRSAVVL